MRIVHKWAKAYRYNLIQRNPMNVLAVLLGILFVNAAFAQAPEKTESYEPFKTLISELDDTARITQLIQFHERKRDRKSVV